MTAEVFVVRASEADRVGRIAYEAYCAHTGGKSAVSGAALPTWQEQSEQIRQAWGAAAVAAASAGMVKE